MFVSDVFRFGAHILLRYPSCEKRKAGLSGI